MAARNEVGILLARIEDLARRAERGEVCATSFLSPMEQHQAKEYLDRAGLCGRYLFWGGYEEAERKKILLLPPYMEGTSTREELAGWGDFDEVATLEVTGSGYRTLTHRDYLGSLLGLGLERDVIGDIAFTGEGKCRVRIFCDVHIAPFLAVELKKVGSDTVKVKQILTDASFTPYREFAEIRDTVASARLDCVVASLCGVSRERAQQLLRDGSVEMDYLPQERCDRNVTPPCLVTVRRYGKYRVTSLSEQTKKGRLRLVAQKYI